MGRATHSRVSVRVLLCPVMYVADKHGREVLEEVSARVGIDVETLDQRRGWIRFETFGAFLAEVLDLAGSEEEFKRACVHRMDEAYGPVRYAFLATTPKLAVKMAIKSMNLVSSVSHGTVFEESRNEISGRYVSTAPEFETRAMCLSRQATTAQLPTLWGLPPAEISEGSCIARGDGSCEYHIRFYSQMSWFATVLGLLSGVAAAVTAGQVGVAHTLTWVILPVLGAALGSLWELRRTYRGNLEHSDKIQDALRELAAADAAARGEIMALNERQRTWSKLLEQQVAERTATLQAFIDKTSGAREEQATSFRGISHDLNNPLTIVRGNASYLAGELVEEPDLLAAAQDIQKAEERIEVMLKELWQLATNASTAARINPGDMSVSSITDDLRRRMNALVHGRDVRVSVFNTRHAPDSIEVDPLIFDRVMDNLLGNAAKYTLTGSVIVELGGRPGFLEIQVSDTGRGIPENEIDRIFYPGASRDRATDRVSHGVGLSVVVKLMSEIGGRLEVMSKVDQGTTFWALFPLEAVVTRATESGESALSSGFEHQIARVVTIRRMSA